MAFSERENSNMRADLIAHIKGQIRLDPAEAAEIMGFFRPLGFGKKENLTRGGGPCNLLFFVVQGCLRMFFINGRGVEHTIEFAIENWWITDHSSFGTPRHTDFYIQAVEKSEVLAIDPQGLEALLHRIPKMERYFRLIHKRAHGAAQFRTKYFFDYSREEMYHHFNENFPDFTQRVPQHLLASFLNMTPEYLSGIKAKKQS